MMAFDALRPYQSQILGLMGQGRTLAQIVDILAAQHGVETTPGTLSRFASSLKSVPPARKPVPPAAEALRASVAPQLTPTQHVQVDTIALVTEFLREIHGLRGECRDTLGHLAGKVGALSADVAELESAANRHSEELAARLSSLEAKLTQPLPRGQPVSVPTASANLILKIWLRAFLATGLFWGVIVAVVWMRWPWVFAAH